MKKWVELLIHLILNYMIYNFGPVFPNIKFILTFHSHVILLGQLPLRSQIFTSYLSFAIKCSPCLQPIWRN